jgi:sugar lactone lactonase YvrE
MLLRFRPVGPLLPLLYVLSFLSARAQTPIALPYTMTTTAGTSPMTAASGTQCPNLAAGVKSTDAFGDGCFAVNGVFGAAARGGVQVDSFGNVFVADDINSIIHVINPTTGIMSVLAGGGTVCSGKLDSAGDGCLAATQTIAKSQRGIGTDPYGNVFLSGYGDNLSHIICRAASPLCTPAQVGYMELVAGCVATTGGSGTGGSTSVIGNDNVKAVEVGAGACATVNGIVDSPRGITGDIYGNVYFADTNTSRIRVAVGPLTSSYFSGNNPLYAALGVYYPSVTPGYMYSVANITDNPASCYNLYGGVCGGATTTKNNTCSNTVNTVTYTGTALDTFGDGCPLNFSSVNSSSGYTSGVAVDAAGNMIFTDPAHGLRVFYVSGIGTAGAKMGAAIVANNPGVTPQPGFIYMLWGGGGTSLGTKPTLGTSTAASDTTIVKVAVSPQGNIFIGDSNKVLFYDMNTGYIRLLFTGSANVTAGNSCSGSSGQNSLSAYSDGCSAAQSLFTNSNGLGLASDGQDNLYLFDASSNSSGMLVRKVLAEGFAPQTVGTTQIQNFQVHIPEAAVASVSSPTATLTTTPDTTAGTLSCGAQNADFSFDCNVPVTTTPSAAGLRSATLTVTVPTFNSAEAAVINVGLGGTATGSVLAFDSAASTTGSTTTPIAPTTNAIFSGIAPAGVALDGAGNVYAMDGSGGHLLEYVQGAGSATLPGTLPVNSGQIAVDQQGDVFVVGSGTPAITELAVSAAPPSPGGPSNFTSTTVAYVPMSGTPAPQAIAVDAAGNLFVADLQGTAANTAIYRLSLVPNTAVPQVTVGTGFTNPVSLAVDLSGNVYVADKGASAVYKLTPGLVSGVPGYVQTTVSSLTGVVPVAVATDPAGNLYVQDAVSLSVIEVPVSGPNTTVLTGLHMPTGLAVDGKGNVYSADLSNTSITQIVRDAVSFNFGIGSTAAPTFAGTVTNVGNQSITGSNTVTNTTNFSVAGGTSNPCALNSSILGAQPAGNACTLVANFVGAGTSTVSDVLSYLPAASTIGELTLTGTLTGTAVGTTTTISSPTPANPSYSATGTEVTFTVTVAATAGTAAPGGTVAVTIDSTTTNPTLVPSGASGVATITLTGLSAGTHTISAIYGTSGSFTGSNSGAPQSFSIAQDATTTGWAPGTASIQFSSPIGTSVLNATATYGGSQVPGVYVYTANGTEVNAATYLAIGSYTLGVTFYPADSVDFGPSTAPGGTLTVTKASTTAAVGVTQNLVAADGTGNYTSLQTAINALPNTGGSIYIKPATYTGFVTVVKPNVSLYGLGGNPNNVVITNEGGAFSAPFLPGQGVGNNGSSGDQGSATMVVARGTVNGFTGTPSNFYADNLTVSNIYNTDTAGTTTNAVVGGVCTAGQPAQTFSALYNSGTECNSQALAIWITGDQAVLNNIYAASLQDTIYAGSISASNAYAARQYWFRGKVTGDVDYIFGDAAAVFDHTSIYTTYHGNTATGTETIEAQNQADETGAAPSYLSGYIMNSDVFTSQSSGMTSLYFGRPYGHYSTWIMLNSYIDQVSPAGYIEFSGDTNLPTSTYAEYNDMTYTDPATGSSDSNGVIYLGSGGSSGSGVTGTRETTSQDPGTPEALNTIKTALTQAQAQQYYPIAFLGSTVPTSPYNTVTNWNPTAAIASGANAFVPSSSASTVAGGSSVTIMMRPQTPGLGAVTNGTYTIPTGTYTLSDSYNGSTRTLASGTLDASGEAYLTTNTLAPGVHSITMSYSGDSNFSASTTSTPYLLDVSASGTTQPVVTMQPSGNPTYGTATSVTVTVSASSGTIVPTGQILLSVDGGAALTGSLSSTGMYTFPLASLSAGNHRLTVIYSGDNTFAAVNANSAILVARSVLQVAANNITVVVGQPLPAYTAAITGFVNGDTQASALIGSPSLTTNPTAPSAVGIYPITVSTGTLASSNYTFTFTNGVLAIQSTTQAAPVATGDTRTVTEPVFPAVCMTLTAALTSINDDIPTSVDATVTNPDGARIQSALNACTNTNQAVRLSIDGAGHNAYLAGPLNMPSGVTLLVDPGVVVYFSRNVQDYDLVAGTHTCGTVNSSSATSSCLPLININNVSNVGIMGFGKLDGRGGDTLLNAFPSSFAGQSWWGLSAIANSGGSQQNPRFIQVGNATNVTLYKITLRNSPLFHVSTTGSGANGLTAWDVKIVTPTSSRNTDGIDPDQAQNFTITRSWISDGDDNVAVGASGSSSSASANISVTNNHFFSGHGESIGSFTSASVSNILFDGNMLAGNSSVDSNSTGIRIKSANDRGGVVTNIQYSNSCFQNHATEIQFTPLYNTNAGTLTPNFKNILLQNLSFLTAGTVGLTGANNNGAINPLGVTFDNVSFATLPSSDLTPAPTNVALTYGPGQISSNFVTDYQSFIGANGNTLTDNRTATSLVPPACSFTFIAPELTGPTGLPQTIISGQTATAVVILTPAVGGSAYPTGTVTLTDGASSTTTVTLPGTGDTLSIPLSNLSIGTHTFTATYSGDSNYIPTVSGTPYSTTEPYVITVNAGSLGSSATALSGVPATTSFGTPFTVTATVAGSDPTGAVQFIVNGAVYATAALGSSGVAQASLNLPIGTYTISAIYSGDPLNAGSSSASSALIVTPAVTVTTLSVSSTTTSLGTPITFTATVSSVAGTPTGTVIFSYTTPDNSTPTTAASATMTNGVATASVDLPIGTDSVTATFVASGSYAASTSPSAIAITVNPPINIPLPGNPIALPYTISTIAGGSTVNSANTTCTGSTDSFGDGCQATSIVFNGSVDLRSVVADPFGNVYLTDANASMVHRIAPNGIISNFAGYVSGTACVPSATTGCTPSSVKLNKPRGVSSDPQGNIYIAGYSDNKVYKFNVSTGLLYLLAGSGTKPSSPTAPNGDGSTAVAAQLNQPRGVWADNVGNVYIADTADNKIRVVDSTGNIQTVAGTGVASSTGDGGLATAATINNPQGVLTDVNDNVYIADSSRVRVICVTCEPGSGLYQLLNQVGIASPQNGNIYTLAGSGSTAYAGPALANTVTMSPQKLAIDNSSNLYISDDNGVVWFVDSRTGFIRSIAGHTSTNCSTATDSFGDGCPATQAIIGDGGNGIGVGTDTLGNIYISDTLNARIRKVSTGLQSPATATSATTTQPIQVHYIAGDNPAAANALAYASSEWQLNTPTCITNIDTTVDCLVSSSFTPAVPGARSTPLAVNSSAGNTAFLALTGTGAGAGATLDPASQTSFASNLQIAGLATDNAGNVYVSDTNSKQLLRFAPAAITQGASATSTTLATLTAPGAVAVDGRGFAYVADTSTGLITQISPAGTVATLPVKFTSPAGITVDALNNLYVSDSSAQSVYQLNPITGAQHTLALTSLVAPAGLAIDPSGNLLVTDPGAATIYRFNLQSGVTTTVSSPAVKPFGIATDAAGNLLIADTASILAVPASSSSAAFTVASVTPSALTIDAAGNLYTSSGGSVLKLTRTQGYVLFASASATPQTVSLLESGNQTLQFSSVSQSDTTDYSLTASGSTDCTLSGILPSAVAVGGACSLTAAFTPTTFANPTDTATFNGNLTNAALSTPSAVQLVLAGPTVPPTATINLGAFSPASPIYGQSVAISATVSGPSVIPAGTVVFTVDSNTISVNLVNATANTSLTGLSAGTHTISAVYTSSNGFTSASTPTTTLTVTQATATVVLTNLAQTYTGSPLSATATTTPAGLAVSLTYNGSTTPPTAAGSYAVVATITNPNYAGSASGTLLIAKASTTLVLSANTTTAIQGQPDLLTATVTGVGQPGGTVVFSFGVVTLCTPTLNAGGVATCTFIPTASGSIVINAQYQGDANHLASSATLALNVYDAAIKLQLSSTKLTYPGATNVTVCLGSTATGTVQIYDGSTLLTTQPLQGGGCAYWYISPGLSAGTHVLTAVYSGDKNNPPGISAPVSVTVNPVSVTMGVSCWNASFAYGANYQCTVNLSSNAGAPLGSITYSFDGGSLVTLPLTNGNAQFTITKPNTGTHTVVVAYAQQTNYAAAAPQTETFTVTAAPVNVLLTPSSYYAPAGTNLTFQTGVTSWSAGPPDANGSVSFYDGSALLATVPVNASGQASYTSSSLSVGTHTITAAYGAGTNYGSGSSSATINLVK